MRWQECVENIRLVTIRSSGVFFFFIELKEYQNEVLESADNLVKDGTWLNLYALFSHSKIKIVCIVDVFC